MVTYIYFVKCPNCEDEHFDFFDEAKEFALGCLTKKPIITQTEVCRNDFGECTDSADLGTVWSWEEAMKNAEPEDTVFSKDETLGISEDLDDFDDFDIGPQIDEFDNSLDFDFDDDDDSAETPSAAEDPDDDESELTEAASAEFVDFGDGYKISREAIYDTIVVNKNDIDIPVGDLGLTNISFEDGGHYSDTTINVSMDKGIFYITEWHHSDDGDLTEGDSFEFRTFEEFWDKLTSYVNVDIEECSRKPIPKGMTIKQLVEEMEENEDEVECALCNDLFDKSTCRKELNLGWLCKRCADDLVARGENPVFKEDNYWDFLDEDKEHHDLGNEYDGGYPAEKPALSEFDEAEIKEVSDSHLKLCPECGKKTFDIETGICIECGFN